MSELREAVVERLGAYRKMLNPDNKGWRVLEVGIDGDEKPGGNYKLFGIGNEYKTLDFLPRLKPDYVADITDTKMLAGEWNLIICSQVLEHVFEYEKAIREIFRLLKTGGWAIIDIPFQFQYHGQPDYDDYWRMSHKALNKVLRNCGFEPEWVELVNPGLVISLSKKPL